MIVDHALCDRFVALLQAEAVGEDRALTAAAVIARLGLPHSAQSRRELRACAHEAVRRGVLVCSGQRGYFVPATRTEAVTSLGRLQAEAFALLARANAGKRLAARAFGAGEESPAVPQLPLFVETGAEA